ncbi:hypothetical protein OC861_005704 [Tilletia horrida]|nr:hypothetical protein OC861_005704 [Tilletia horrida]
MRSKQPSAAAAAAAAAASSSSSSSNQRPPPRDQSARHPDDLYPTSTTASAPAPTRSTALPSPIPAAPPYYPDPRLTGAYSQAPFYARPAGSLSPSRQQPMGPPPHPQLPKLPSARRSQAQSSALPSSGASSSAAALAGPRRSFEPTPHTRVQLPLVPLEERKALWYDTESTDCIIIVPCPSRENEIPDVSSDPGSPRTKEAVRQKLIEVREAHRASLASGSSASISAPVIGPLSSEAPDAGADEVAARTSAQKGGDLPLPPLPRRDAANSLLDDDDDEEPRRQTAQSNAATAASSSRVGTAGDAQAAGSGNNGSAAESNGESQTAGASGGPYPRREPGELLLTERLTPAQGRARGELLRARLQLHGIDPDRAPQWPSDKDGNRYAPEGWRQRQRARHGFDDQIHTTVGHYVEDTREGTFKRRIFRAHVRVLATQSGLLDELLTPAVLREPRFRQDTIGETMRAVTKSSSGFAKASTAHQARYAMHFIRPPGERTNENAEVERIIFLPMPDPDSVPLMLHFLYFHDEEVFQSALTRDNIPTIGPRALPPEIARRSSSSRKRAYRRSLPAEVIEKIPPELNIYAPWRGVFWNVEHLMLGRPLEVFLGAWFKSNVENVTDPEKLKAGRIELRDEHETAVGRSMSMGRAPRASGTGKRGESSKVGLHGRNASQPAASPVERVDRSPETETRSRHSTSHTPGLAPSPVDRERERERQRLQMSSSTAELTTSTHLTIPGASSSSTPNRTSPNVSRQPSQSRAGSQGLGPQHSLTESMVSSRTLPMPLGAGPGAPNPSGSPSDPRGPLGSPWRHDRGAAEMDWADVRHHRHRERERELELRDREMESARREQRNYEQWVREREWDLERQREREPRRQSAAPIPGWNDVRRGVRPIVEESEDARVPEVGEDGAVLQDPRRPSMWSSALRGPPPAVELASMYEREYERERERYVREGWRDHDSSGRSPGPAQARDATWEAERAEREHEYAVAAAAVAAAAASARERDWELKREREREMDHLAAQPPGIARFAPPPSLRALQLAYPPAPPPDPAEEEERSRYPDASEVLPPLEPGERGDISVFGPPPQVLSSIGGGDAGDPAATAAGPEAESASRKASPEPEGEEAEVELPTRPSAGTRGAIAPPPPPPPGQQPVGRARAPRESDALERTRWEEQQLQQQAASSSSSPFRFNAPTHGPPQDPLPPPPLHYLHRQHHSQRSHPMAAPGPGPYGASPGPIRTRRAGSPPMHPPSDREPQFYPGPAPASYRGSVGGPLPPPDYPYGPPAGSHSYGYGGPPPMRHHRAYQAVSEDHMHYYQQQEYYAAHHRHSMPLDPRGPAGGGGGGGGGGGTGSPPPFSTGLPPHGIAALRESASALYSSRAAPGRGGASRSSYAAAGGGGGGTGGGESDLGISPPVALSRGAPAGSGHKGRSRSLAATSGGGGYGRGGEASSSAQQRSSGIRQELLKTKPNPYLPRETNPHRHLPSYKPPPPPRFPRLPPQFQSTTGSGEGRGRGSGANRRSGAGANASSTVTGGVGGGGGGGYDEEEVDELID